jgi:hypothetical protein
VSVSWENTLTPGLEALKKRLAAGEHLVKVGLPSGPKMESDGTASTKSLEEVALINEFGSQDGHVPERPAWRLGLAHGQEDFNRLNRANLKLVADGKKTLAQALGELGAMGAGRVKTEIDVGDFEPNAPSTIAKKKSSHPLIETTQEKNSVTWEVMG